MSGRCPIPEHLRQNRVHGGLPVPEVVSTLKGHLDLAPSSWPDSDMMTVWVPEGTDPDFGKYDEEKHRRCMHGGWCHVCGKIRRPLMLCDPTRTEPLDGQHIEYGGKRRPLIRQPWVCAECLAFAVKHCPPLKQAIEERRGVVFFPVRTMLVQVFYGPTKPTDPQPPTPETRVIMGIKVAILTGRSMPLPDWAGRVIA